MKHAIINYAIIFLLAALMGYSCKKSANNNPFGDALIATAVITNGGAIQNYGFFYDSHNNLDSVSISGSGSASGTSGFLKYSYIGSSWSVTDQNGNSFMVYANTNGQLLKVLVADTLTFTYSNNQLTEINQYATTATPPYYINTTTYYTWLNGNVTTAVTGSEDQTYTYNNGKNGQPGDGIRIQGFLAYGASPVKTTNLPAGIASSSTEGVNYFYAFDSQGRIGTMTAVAYDKTLSTSDTTTYAYTYK